MVRQVRPLSETTGKHERPWWAQVGAIRPINARQLIACHIQALLGYHQQHAERRVSVLLAFRRRCF